LASDQVDLDRIARLGMLASALSGRTLQVAPAGPGEPAWTDGATIFVDARATARRRLEALAVQASMLAAGSLEPKVLRILKRRPAVARRYLAVEGHRALAAIGDLLPPPVRALVDRDVAARSDSPASSLAVALSGLAIADPPESFGTIRARNLLASKVIGEHIGRGRRAGGRLNSTMTTAKARAKLLTSSPAR
jgi:nitric oxide reductase NorD protein